MATQGDPLGGSQPPRRVATVLESVEDVRDLIRRTNTIKEAVPVALQQQTQPEAETQPFRATHRPSIAHLVVLDDGDDSGETIRIRGDRFAIGRADGDLIIPHDNAISGRHAEITRRFENGQFHWYLSDLQSRNGTFVRVSRTLLTSQQEIMLGSRVYRLETIGPQSAAEPQGAPNATRKWSIADAAEAGSIGAAVLVEQSQTGANKRFPLSGAEQWIGRDPRQCSIVVDDPMVNPRHARLYRDARGRWQIENAQSLNGLWLRISELPLGRGGQFQCGEQRFIIKIS